MKVSRRTALTGLGAVGLGASVLTGAILPARAADREVIDTRVNLALGKLWEQVPSAKDLASRARGMLVMPKVVKGVLIIGGAYGEGALKINDPVVGYEKHGGYFSLSSASVGLQIGVQKTSHVLFFMTDKALNDFQRADGWEVGVDAEVTFPDAGVNTGVSSTTYEKPVIAVVFGEDGLLVGASLEGAKYSHINR